MDIWSQTDLRYTTKFLNTKNQLTKNLNIDITVRFDKTICLIACIF